MSSLQGMAVDGLLVRPRLRAHRPPRLPGVARPARRRAGHAGLADRAGHVRPDLRLRGRRPPPAPVRGGAGSPARRPHALRLQGRRSSGGCRPGWARSSSPRSTRRSSAGAWSSASSAGSTGCGSTRTAPSRRSSSPARPSRRPGQRRTSRSCGSAALPCWPARPLVDQLAADPGDELESALGPGDGDGDGDRCVAGGGLRRRRARRVRSACCRYVAGDLVAAAPGLARHGRPDRRRWPPGRPSCGSTRTEAELGWTRPVRRRRSAASATPSTPGRR